MTWYLIVIDVWCVCTGDKYSKNRVDALVHMVDKNLTIPHRFMLINDDNTPLSYKSWWDKLRLFGRAEEPSIYFDLDVIIARNIDYLVDYTKYPIAAPANWAQSGHGGIQSSVMCWNGENREPWEKFNYSVDSHRLHGDQCFLTELYGDTFVKIPGVKSYKYHCRGGLPGDAHIVAFHGKPDYWEVNDPWIKEALS